MTGLRDTDPEVARAPAEINIVFVFSLNYKFFCTENSVCDVGIFAEGSLDSRSVKTLCEDWDVTGHVFCS